jgi:hypothetical protein
MGADRNQWQFPRNEAGKVPGWRDDGKGMENKEWVSPADLDARAPAISANTMLVDNAGGTAREAKSFADVRGLLDVAPYVATRTALKALDTTKDTTAILTEAGREGVFNWKAGDYSAEITADTAEGVYAKADAIASTAGAWLRVDRNVVNPAMFGALRGRANATATTAAIQAMIEYCEREGAEFDLLGGSWFINGEGLAILNPVRGRGRGIGYWHEYAAAFDNGTNQEAQTQLILTGTGTNTISPHGMSSMRVSGGVVANASARALWNETEYSLLNLNGDFSCGLYIGPDAAGSALSGFRILPDGGGDDGLDLYNDTAATASSGWADDWDFGIIADSAASIKMDMVQSVGHYRMSGLLITAINITPSDDVPRPPYGQSWSRCQFEGFRGVAVRGSDTFRITGLAATYVEIEYAADHPFDELVEDRVAFSKNSFSHTVYTFTGKSIIGGTTLRLTGLNADPTASFAIGDTIVARPFGGGTSHISFSDCQVGGMKHPSGLQCHDQALGADAMPSPGTCVEMSGNRMVEIIFDPHCRIQSGEQVAVHLHDCADVQLPGMIEFDTDIDGNTRGMRIITSPLYSSNTRVTNAAGSTVRPRFGTLGVSAMLNNNGPSGCLDLRPAVDISSAAYALFTSDSGMLWASDLIIPDLAMYLGMNSTIGLRSPKGGVAGIFGDTYPTPLAKFVYDATLDYLIQYEHIKPDADVTRDIGEFAKRIRAAFVRDIRLYPSASVTPANNGELMFQATSNTSLTVKYKGSDGTVRSVNLTLA